ncbi:MAG: flippase-like domain-containing protein [Thermococcus sp.]|uniref:Membrane protein n=1 Tax=Thermococcus guaymasensis DSM 11113 TaxID=1432656 RepID=A0A0X1KKK5_9EURY|nr:lysylphosphatidylglycerol synthase transmembrane domain-containing protein [Thermococcus guaymasensis]AJC71786.1 membrane protein [Thermococcus guaymasensis DSM 11113]MCD6524071.1 flippase-like domain-containing protein [Thermococcus sp.]RLF88928.1 MAG: TIGR00374 family protein [Thermococci archaeon]
MVFENLVQSTEEYIGVLRHVPIHYLLLAIGTYYLSVFLFALRWKYVLKGTGVDVPLAELFKANLAGLFVNNITPMSRGGGELLRMAWISKLQGIPMRISAVTVVYERILESIPVMVMVALGFLYFTTSEAFALIPLVVGLALIWLKWEKFIELTLRLFRVNLSEEERERIVTLRKRGDVNLVGIGTSSLVWVLDVLRLKLITLALGLNVSLPVLVLASVINLILGIAAFTPGGIGVVEGGLIGTLTYLGFPPALAVSTVLLERFISYVLGSISGLLVLLTSGGREAWRALKSR